MEKIDQFGVYDLGAGLKPLAARKVPRDHLDAMVALLGAERALRDALDGPKGLSLSLSRSAAEALHRQVQELRLKHFTDSDGALLPDRERFGAIPSRVWEGIWRSIQAFETLLRAEFASAPTFRVPKRGIFDTEALVNAAGEAIPGSLTPFVPAMALDEIGSAGRALAFGLYSAAGFHICRAVESVLEEYYYLFAGAKTPLRSWYDYFKELDKMARSGTNPAPHLTTVAYIDQLRQSSRNPIMHPRVVLDEGDALAIFDLGKGLMVKMAQEMKATRAAAPAVGLAVAASGGPP